MPLKQIAYYNNIFFNRFTIIWNDFHNFRYRNRYRKTSDYSLFVKYKECIHFMNIRWIIQQWVCVHITFVDPNLPTCLQHFTISYLLLPWQKPLSFVNGKVGTFCILGKWKKIYAFLTVNDKTKGKLSIFGFLVIWKQSNKTSREPPVQTKGYAQANLAQNTSGWSVENFHFLKVLKAVHTWGKSNNRFYYTTKLLGGLIQKIHQSDRAIAGLIFSKYQTGSVRIRPEIELFKMADAEKIEVYKLSHRNTKQFLSRRRRPPIWAWFGHVKQSGKTRGSRWTWERRSQLSSSRASRFYRRTQIQFNTVRKTISIWHEALWYNDELDKRTETTVSIIVVQEIRRIQSVWFWQSSRAEYSLLFADLVFSDTKSRVINLLLTEFARAVLGEYRPSVFLVQTSPKRLGPYCQDLGPIFSQHGPRTRSIRYIFYTREKCWLMQGRSISISHLHGQSVIIIIHFILSENSHNFS